MSKWLPFHHHQWWLTDYAGYGPEGNMNKGSSYTVFTYICRVDHSHTKQVRLQGDHEQTADLIFARQREEQSIEAVPDVFKNAWEKKDNAK